MSSIDTTATEYRDLPLRVLIESTTNPRRIFDEAGLNELATSIRDHGVLEPLLVRPRNERTFEIVSGARRFRAAKIAEADSCPCPHQELYGRAGTGVAVDREPSASGRASSG